MKSYFSLLFILLMPILVSAQEDTTHVVQFSGTVLDGAGEELIPVPFTNILVKNKSRGTYSDYSGFFSIVIEKGDVIKFTAVGYQDVEYTMPDSLTETRYSIIQLMTRDTINLPETVVYPWPSKEHFETEFLALDVKNPMLTTAEENLSEKKMKVLRETLKTDGNENADYYLRQQAKSAYYYGQAPPQNIFSPLAWAKFIQSWKNGDYKKKKKKKKKRH